MGNISKHLKNMLFFVEFPQVKFLQLLSPSLYQATKEN